MISLLEYLTPRGHVRRQLFSLGRVAKHTRKPTKITTGKESSDKVKIQSSLSRKNMPKGGRHKPWLGRFHHTRK